jgi:Immunoglobulin I-set domain
LFIPFSFFLYRDRIKFEKIRKTDAGRYACHSAELQQWYNVTLRVMLDQFQNDAPTKLQNFGGGMEAHSLVDTNADGYYDDRSGNKDDETNQNERFPYFTERDQLKKSIASSQGETVHLKCNAAGNPKPNITWTKDRGMIARSMEEPLYKGYILVLKNLVPKDSGAYDCKVCNKLGCINYTTKLEVLGEFYFYLRFYMNTAKNKIFSCFHSNPILKRFLILKFLIKNHTSSRSSSIRSNFY